MLEDGGEILLDVLRKWSVIKQKHAMSVLVNSDTAESKVRFAQGELSAYRALEQVLSNPSGKLRNLLKQEIKDETEDE